jgi:hypothetical protein
LSISDAPDVPEPRLLQPEVQEFIRAHTSSDVHELSLKQPPLLFGIAFPLIAKQIAGRQQIRLKLPLYYTTQGILYASRENLEQCSSERAARYKAEQAAALSGLARHRCVDLTGGFGVDTYFLSRHYTEVHYVEQNRQLLQIARHNHRQLGATNIVYHEADALTFLEKTSLTFDLAYLDPSRRTDNNKRKIELTAYSPDIRTIIPILGKTFTRMMVKVSPMLDIDRGLQVIPNVAQVHVVAVGGEVREMLFFSEAGHNAEPLLETVDLSSGRQPFSFYRSQERVAPVQFGALQKYVYEPAPEILKAGGFRLVASRFGVIKLHVNTHLYTSEKLVEDFPGRTYEIIATASRFPDLAEFFPERMANIVVRNHPRAPDGLRAELRLREGGERYLLAFTAPDGPMLAAARRLS